MPRYDRVMTGAERGPRWGFDLAFCGALLAFGVSVTTRADLANGTIVDTLLLPAVVLPVLVRAAVAVSRHGRAVRRGGASAAFRRSISSASASRSRPRC